MNLKRAIAHLACVASLLALALPGHAVPTVSLGLSPTSIPAGGQATLYITIYDDSNNGFSAGNLIIAYPPGLTNVGGASYWDCGGSLAAGAGSSVLANTGINLPALTNCFIYVPVTAAAGGTYTIGAPANALVASTGNSAASNTVTLTAVAPIVVTNTNDTGAGSLRDAINTVNASCTAALAINFNIPGTGPHTIQPATPLPMISCPGLIIDGFSQPGSSANTQSIPSGDDANLQLILNGTGCLTCNGFTVGVQSVTVRGFAIHSFQGAGIEVLDSGVSITGNYIGTDPGGMTALGNGTGVHVSGGYALIGSPSPQHRNLITANGIGVHSQSGAIIYNTQVGGRRDASLGMGNTGRGIFYNASNYTSQNVNASLVIGNGAQGISVDAATLPRVVMQGVMAFGNGGIGIDLNDDGPTPNDETGPPYDTDSGANRLMNYPVVTAVAFDGFSTTISGYIKSEPNSQVQVYLYGNDAPSTLTQGQLIIDTFGGTLDATGFMSFTRVLGGSRNNVSAQMTADTCGDGCVYSSEYSPSVAQTATLSCNIGAFVQATGDGIVTGATVLAVPGGTVTLYPLCGTFPTSTVWNTGQTSYSIDVIAPAAGATATYTLNATAGAASGTFTITLQGALAGTPVCTLATSPALPLAPTVGSTFTVTASCSPAASGYNWVAYGSGPTTFVSGQGTPTATYQVGAPVEPGIGYHIQMDPSNAAGPGPSATRIIWFAQVAITAPASMDFGTIAAGTQSAPQSVTFQNLSSTNSAYFMNVAVSGPYAVTNNCPDPLPPSASCTIDIRFAPSVAGTNQAGTANASYSFPGNPSVSIAMTGSATGAPGVMFTPTSLTFPARTVSTTSPAQTVTLSNNGTATLAISSISITGDFAFTSNCGATLAPFASCTIDVTFTPLVVGARNGVLSVADNASASPHTVALTGTGLSTAAAVLGVSPGVVDYSAQPVGSDSPPQVVTVSNSGNAPLTFTTLSISGEFRIVAPPAGATPQACPATLAPGATCRIDVVFHPLGFNLREGALTIATNGGNIVLRVMGTGLVPEPPQLQVPISMDFGTRAVGTRSAAQPAPLRNVSPYVANLTELTASGDFAVSDTCLTIAAGATCSPSVTFQPSGIGPREGALTVRTLRDAAPYVIRLIGNGLENREPVLELSVRQVGFGNAFVGQLVPREVTLRNVGQGVLQVSAILTGSDFFTDGACIGPIAPNASCTVRVTFNPSSAGGRGAQLQVLSNAADSPHSVTLTGTGCFLPTPSRARFGSLLCGS